MLFRVIIDLMLLFFMKIEFRASSFEPKYTSSWIISVRLVDRFSGVKGSSFEYGVFMVAEG